MRIEKIFILARSLDYGGTERQLVELAKGLHKLGCNVSVGVFYSGGMLENYLNDAGITVIPLNKKGRWDFFLFLFRLCNVVRKNNTDVLYSFLCIPCIMALFVKLVQPDLKIIWGVRASNMDLNCYDWLVKLSYRLECFLSRFPDLIISNSNAGRLYALSNGFPVAKTIVIPNGVDTSLFTPDDNARQKLRAEWNVKDDETLIGLVARLDPMKDHPNFFQAACQLIEQKAPVRFICVGDGVEPYRHMLHALADQMQIADKLIWAGARNDMVAVYNALDIHVLSSITEGFPNVVAEAMSCGTPCVVTDVGDSRLIVGDPNLVVPPKEPVMLAERLNCLIVLNPLLKNDLKIQVRDRIVSNFSNHAMITETLTRISELK